MSTLWAPWRMEYILGPKSDVCVFCELAKGARDGDHVLVTRERAFVCLNRFPFAAGHILVVPKSHVSNPWDLTQEEHDDFQNLVRDASHALREAVRCEGMNIGINLGKAGGAGIADHLHAHAVPRWSGDSNFMPVLADVRVMPEYLNQTYERLKPYFERLG